MKEGDVYALDDGTSILIALGNDGYNGVLLEKNSCVILKYTIDDAYLHSMRAVAMGNICEALYDNQSSRP